MAIAMKISSVNPFTGEVNGEFELLSMAQASEEIAGSRKAFARWRDVPVSERSALLKSLAAVLRKNARKYAEMITREMGKPITEARAEIEKCAWISDYFAENAEKFLADESVSATAGKSYVSFEPLGIVLGIMPWNFPFWQAFRFAVPAVAAGNVCALKHASNVPMCAEEIEKAFIEAGFPANVFRTLMIDPKTAAEIIEKDLVDGVSLTGSVAAGSQIGSVAGKRIKKVVLELGGSDPFVVLDDADVKKAAETAVRARFVNAGQSCVAAKRFIVMKSVQKEFEEELIRQFKSLKVGDPMDEATQIGPLAKKEFAEALGKQLEDARKKGAEIVLGPEPPRNGFFFRPAAVLKARPEMAVMSEEVFGPIAPVMAVATEEEAVKIANSTEFGLGASVWSRDLKRAESVARRMDAGFVAINDTVKSDPRLPFGGVKKSGVGRELSVFGIREFVNVKTVVVQGGNGHAGD